MMRAIAKSTLFISLKNATPRPKQSKRIRPFKGTKKKDPAKSRVKNRD